MRLILPKDLWIAECCQGILGKKSYLMMASNFLKSHYGRPQKVKPQILFSTVDDGFYALIQGLGKIIEDKNGNLTRLFIS